MLFHEVQSELREFVEELRSGIIDPEWMDSVCNLRDLHCAAQHITDMLEATLFELAHDAASALPLELLTALAERD